MCYVDFEFTVPGIAEGRAPTGDDVVLVISELQSPVEAHCNRHRPLTRPLHLTQSTKMLNIIEQL